MDRKEKLKVLGDYFGVRPKYLGAPSFAYEIQTEDETYTMDKDGAITTGDGQVLSVEEIVSRKQKEQLAHGQKDGDAAQAESSAMLDMDALNLTLPLEGHTGATLQNVINMLSSKQHLIMQAYEANDPFMDEDFASDLSLEEIGTLDDLKWVMEILGQHRYPGLTFEFDEGTFTIKLTATGLTTEKVSAFQNLMVFINDSAKKQKRTSFKPAQDDNPKYAFRTWLIRLGMNGSEYKSTRKVLLCNLAGSSAFRQVDEKGKGENISSGEVISHG